MAKLAAEGLADNTMVVISSDNGGAGYIGLPGINGPYRGGKINSFEGGLRVPLFARWPARIAAGTRSDLPVGHVDLMPTLAAAASAPLPASVTIDGRNLLPAMTGRGNVERAADPTETTDLAARNPAKRAELQALIDTHHRGRKPPLYASTTDLAVMIDKTLAERFTPSHEFVYWPN